ncbi:MAG: SPFH domain-containing protein [Deltaproteobacteria bacterium]|jgi:membrane protease subunit (stomatin/prohibitin family)|nr:SPFH domain-containing protein [Deltaproteobacteria bacterium]
MAIIDVVKFNGPTNVFAWKFPSEELSSYTQVIVNESQEAIFFKGGQALDVLGPGRHTLSTDNIPILSSFMKIPFGGKSPFAAEIWYVNKSHCLDIKWGTPTPVQIQDPKFKIMVPVRSFGQFGITIENSSKFLVKLVGVSPVFDQETLLRHFRGLYLNKVKDALAGYLLNRNIGVLEINAYLEEFSANLLERVRPAMEEYGITLVNFYVYEVSVPENDPAVVQLKAALAKRAEMDIIGYNYQQERAFDTLEGAATNPGAAQAGLMGAGLGLGMGVGVGGAMGGQFSTLAQSLNLATSIECSKCHGQAPEGVKFCPHCGNSFAAGVSPPPKVVVCDKCGAALSPNDSFCPQCGDPYNPCPNCQVDLPVGAVKCPSCGFALPQPCSLCGQSVQAGAKFCPHCGGSLVKQCPQCGKDAYRADKFCSGCGLKL